MLGSVLKSNGIYTNISNIQKNDYVINANGLPSRITNVEKIKIKKNTEIVKINHHNWYEDLYIYDNYDILNLEANPSWKCLNFLEKKNSVYSMINTNIEWDLPYNFEHKFGKFNIKPSYKLGYLFGIYLLLGYTNKYNGICFNISNKNKFIVDNIINYFEEIFNITPMLILLEKNKHKISILSIVDEDLFDIFDEFYSKKTYILPLLYRCSLKEFNLGINEALNHCKINNNDKVLSKEIYELLSFTSLNTNNKISYNNVITSYKNENYLCCLININYHITDSPIYFYKIYTDNKTDKSFIINNLGICIN